MKTFNLNDRSFAIDPFANMINNYDEFFSEQQDLLNKKVEILLEGRTVWETMQESVNALDRKLQVEYMHSIEAISQKDYDEFLHMEKEVWLFFDSVIHS